jgi:alpha/beta superfamily hydrolase
MDGVRFTTDDGVSLEGDLRLPDAAPRGSAVLCHPHPRGGGSKDHPVLWAVRNELAAREFAVLAFNFRGVMRSAGTYGGGRAEVEDVRAAVGLVLERSTGPVLSFGWSFGANVAIRASIEDERVGALALVGLPLGQAATDLPDLPSTSELRAFRRPVLLLSGEGDTFSPRPELETLARRLRGAELEVLAGTDHFFWHREDDVAAIVGAFAQRALGR